MFWAQILLQHANEMELTGPCSRSLQTRRHGTSQLRLFRTLVERIQVANSLSWDFPSTILEPPLHRKVPRNFKDSARLPETHFWLSSTNGKIQLPVSLGHD
jgi:hypothetical protein